MQLAPTTHIKRGAQVQYRCTDSRVRSISRVLVRYFGVYCLILSHITATTAERTLFRYHCEDRAHVVQAVQAAGLKLYRDLRSACALSVEGPPHVVQQLFSHRRSLLTHTATREGSLVEIFGDSTLHGINLDENHHSRQSRSLDSIGLPHVFHIEQDNPRYLDGRILPESNEPDSESSESDYESSESDSLDQNSVLSDATHGKNDPRALQQGVAESSNEFSRRLSKAATSNRSIHTPVTREKTCSPPCMYNDKVLPGTHREVLPYGVQMVQATLPELTNDIFPNNTKDYGITICVIDSGVDSSHPDLAGNFMTGCEDPDICPDPWQVDSVGHGTHVAGTLAAIRNGIGVVGVIPAGAHLHFVRIFNDNGATTSDVVAALSDCQTTLRYLQKSNKDAKMVVSMSFSGNEFSQVEQDFIDEAYAEGDMLFVAAAGNTGLNVTAYPAGYDNVVSVAAVHCTEQRASFSCTSPMMSLAAPGTGIRSLVPRTYAKRDPVASVKIPSRPDMYFNTQPFTITASGTVVGPLHDCGDGASFSDWQACRAASPGSVCLLKYRYDVYACGAVTALQRAGCAAIVIWHNTTDHCELGTGVPYWLDGCYDDSNGKTMDVIALAVAHEDGMVLRGLLERAGPVPVLVNVTVERLKGPYDYRPGTSMATPHVSGVAARLWAAASGCSAKDIRRAMELGAKDLGKEGVDVEFGYGLLQAKGALEVLRKMDCFMDPMTRETSSADNHDNGGR